MFGHILCIVCLIALFVVFFVILGNFCFPVAHMNKRLWNTPVNVSLIVRYRLFSVIKVTPSGAYCVSKSGGSETRSGAEPS